MTITVIACLIALAWVCCASINSFFCTRTKVNPILGVIAIVAGPIGTVVILLMLACVIAWAAYLAGRAAAKSIWSILTK